METVDGSHCETSGLQEHLYKVLVIGDYGVGKIFAVSG